jgi:2-keto-4-pentenoate hydratase/2-oxohepta-3-ene-1,7-dioic acid hydratase in catechol pathway
MTFSLVTFTEGQDASGPRVGVLLAGGQVVEPAGLKRWPSMLDLLDDWTSAASVLDELDPAELAHLEPIAGARLLAPVRWPRKVLCAGVNYRKHVAEMGGRVPGGDWQPYFFLKPPTTTVTGPSDPIVIRDADNARYDWEVELAVVIGRGGRDIPPARARNHIAGYCVANDITARGYHRRQSPPAEPFSYDWVAAKAADTSLPLGPGLTPAKFITDPQNLHLRLWLNGELQQDETSADMICPVDELVAAASKLVTLEPGDVIATGTPSGVGVTRGIALKHDDVVTAAIEGLGQISNRVIDAERSEP